MTMDVILSPPLLYFELFTSVPTVTNDPTRDRAVRGKTERSQYAVERQLFTRRLPSPGHDPQ